MRQPVSSRALGSPLAGSHDGPRTDLLVDGLAGRNRNRGFSMRHCTLLRARYRPVGGREADGLRTRSATLNVGVETGRIGSSTLAPASTSPARMMGCNSPPDRAAKQFARHHARLAARNFATANSRMLPGVRLFPLTLRGRFTHSCPPSSTPPVRANSFSRYSGGRCRTPVLHCTPPARQWPCRLDDPDAPSPLHRMHHFEPRCGC